MAKKIRLRIYFINCPDIWVTAVITTIHGVITRLLKVKTHHLFIIKSPQGDTQGRGCCYGGVASGQKKMYSKPSTKIHSSYEFLWKVWSHRYIRLYRFFCIIIIVVAIIVTSSTRTSRGRKFPVYKKNINL